MFGIEDHVVGREAGLRRHEVVRAAENLDLALDGVRLPALVEGHDHDGGAEPANRPRLLEERLLALLQRDRVDDSLALQAAKAGLERGEARAVDHDRQPGSLGLGGKEIEEGRHRLLGVEQVGVHVHVEQIRPAAHLLERNVDGTLEVVRLDQPAKTRRPGHVRPLAHDDEPGVGADHERIEAGEAWPGVSVRDTARRQPLHSSGDRMGVLRCGPAAAADEVDEAVLRERPQVAARVRRLLVVEAERVREPGVRMARHVRGRDAREPLEERPHLRCAERAVHPHDERLGMLDGDPERVGGLAREIASAAVDRGEREPQRQLGRNCLRGNDRCLGVQRVEDRLDQEEVDAAVAQRADLLLVGGLHRVEGHGPECRVFDLRRERKRDVERADRARDEARLVRCSCGPSVGGGARKARSLEAHLGRRTFERVIGLADRRRREGVRGCDVRARLEVRVVDLGDDLGRGQVQEIRVALDVVRVRGEALAAVLLLGESAAVDEHAPRPVEHEDSLGEECSELFSDVLHEIGSRLKGREPEGSRALGVW